MPAKAEPTTARAYLAAASPRYRAAHRALGQAVRRVFPRAKPVFAFGMPGWKAPRPKDAPRPPREGTMPSDAVMVLLAEGKTGLTAHLWYPGDYRFLDRHRAALAKVGLRLGRGCIVWGRVGDFPVAAVAGLLREVRARDARPAAPRRGLKPPSRWRKSSTTARPAPRRGTGSRW